MRKLKVCIVGTRGIPGLQGGVEKRIEKIYTRVVVNKNFQITVINRNCYFNRYLNNWKGINLVNIWSLRNKYFEAPIHTFLAVVYAKIKSYDIVDIQAIGPAFFSLLAKVLGLKVVVTHHGPDYLRKKWGRVAKLVLRLGEFFAIKFADKIILVSEYIKDYLEKKYKRYDLIVIPNGVDLTEIIPAGETLKKFNLESKKYIFTVCRFVPEKGLHDLLSAYRKIENPEFKLVISGDADHETDYSRNLKTMAQETEGVILTGVVTGRSLQELYSNAGLFVLPSYYEGLPIALLEALSYGLSVLVSDIPPHKEIPLSEFRYFPCGNIEKLKGKIIELYHKGISDEEKKNILNYLNKNHNWDISANKLLEVYEKLK